MLVRPDVVNSPNGPRKVVVAVNGWSRTNVVVRAERGTARSRATVTSQAGLDRDSRRQIVGSYRTGSMIMLVMANGVTGREKRKP
jgi:hypothetical protein